MAARMRTIQQQSFGGPEVLQLATVDRPEPGLTEILVRVRAAGVNPTDWKNRAGKGFITEPGQTLGWDVSGVVEQVGAGVAWLAPGDEVFGMPLFPHIVGGYSEFVVAPSRHFARKPAELDHVQAAALPLAGLTAWQSLVDTANVQPGQRVLVHAAAGGVGHLAVQIAKARGAYVIGTARAEKHDYLRTLGADEAVDYTDGDWSATIREIDIVIDSIAGDYLPRSLATLRPGGVLVALPSGISAEFSAAAAAQGVRAGWTVVEPDQLGLLELVKLVRSGQLRVDVDQVLPLEQAAKAHELGETGRTKGKLVLSVSD